MTDDTKPTNVGDALSDFLSNPARVLRAVASLLMLAIMVVLVVLA